jgi:hypothetical protein
MAGESVPQPTALLLKGNMHEFCSVSDPATERFWPLGPVGIAQLLPSIEEVFCLSDKEISLGVVHAARCFSTYQVGLRLFSCYLIQAAMNRREAFRNLVVV